MVACQSQSDHHSSVGLFFQVVTCAMLGSPQEDLVSYLDLSCGCLPGRLMSCLSLSLVSEVWRDKDLVPQQLPCPPGW